MIYITVLNTFFLKEIHNKAYTSANTTDNFASSDDFPYPGGANTHNSGFSIKINNQLMIIYCILTRLTVLMLSCEKF